MTTEPSQIRLFPRLSFSPFLCAFHLRAARNLSEDHRLALPPARQSPWLQKVGKPYLLSLPRRPSYLLCKGKFFVLSPGPTFSGPFPLQKGGVPVKSGFGSPSGGNPSFLAPSALHCRADYRTEGLKQLPRTYRTFRPCFQALASRGR